MTALTEQLATLLAITTVPTDFSQGEAAAATRALLARDERPTAIVYDSDVAAPAATTALSWVRA